MLVSSRRVLLIWGLMATPFLFASCTHTTWTGTEAEDEDVTGKSPSLDNDGKAPGSSDGGSAPPSNEIRRKPTRFEGAVLGVRILAPSCGSERVARLRSQLEADGFRQVECEPDAAEEGPSIAVDARLDGDGLSAWVAARVEAELGHAVPTHTEPDSMAIVVILGSATGGSARGGRIAGSTEGGVCQPTESNLAPAEAQIFLFTDHQKGRGMAPTLRDQGYRDVTLYGPPSPTLNIKFGKQSCKAALDLRAKVARLLGLQPGAIALLESFEANAPYVYINAGYLGWLQAQNHTHEGGPIPVTIYSSSGQGLEKRLGSDLFKVSTRPPSAGRAHAVRFGSEVPTEVANAVYDIVCDELGLDPVKEDSQFTLASKPSLGRKLEIFIDEGQLPVPCDGSGHPGQIIVGQSYKLRRHRFVRGQEDWTVDMDRYVGECAKVTAEAGRDGAGCAVVRIDVDQGKHVWRARDLEDSPYCDTRGAGSR